MMSRLPDPKKLVAPHLTDNELLTYVDGEAVPLERERITRHLESCWTCRTRLGEINKSIERLIEIRKTLQPPSAYGTDEMRIEQFRNLLARHAEGLSDDSMWLRFKRRLSVFRA